MVFAVVRPAAAQTGGTIVDTLRTNTTLTRVATTGDYVDLTAGAYYTDNARRSQFNTVNDTVSDVGLAVDTEHRGTRLEYALNGNVQYLKYSDDIYKPETFGAMDGSARFAFVPERFDWIVRDSFNRLLLDPTQAVTPTNLETYNYFTTGPRLLLRFGSAMQLILQAEYSRLTSIDSANLDGTGLNLGSNRYGGHATFAYLLSERSRLSLNGNTQRVRYNQASSNADYTRTEVSVGYDVRIARTTFAAEVGGSRITQRNNNSNGLLARLGATRRISPASDVELSVLRQTADSADIIRYDFSPTNATEAPLRVATRDPLVDTTFTLSWHFRKPRTEASADLFRMQERYTVSKGVDRDVTGVRASVERRLQPRWGVQVFRSFQHQKLTASSLSDQELDVSAMLNWYAGRQLRLTLRGDHFRRHAPSSNLIFTENRIGVQIGYDLLRPRR